VTPQDILTLVRRVIKDDDAVAYRNNDEAIRTAIVRALRRIAIIRPDLFTTVAPLATTPGETLQSVPNYGRIMEVFRVEGGRAVLEVTREIMDQLIPDWPTHAAGPCENWMRHNRDPSRFFIYPMAPAVQNLVAQYAVAPGDLALSDPIPVSDVYAPVIVDCTVAEIEWADDEHMLNQRGDAFYARVSQTLMASNQSKQQTDLEESGGDPKVVS